MSLHLNIQSRSTRQLARIRQRFQLVLVAGTVILLLLLLQISWMQTIHKAHFSALSSDNRLRQVPVSPPRGLIFDRNGTLLADNGTQYELQLVPAQISDLEDTLEQLHQLTPISESEIHHFKKESQAHRHRQNSLKQNLTEEDVARLAVNLHRFPGVYVNASPMRRYTYRETTAHALGYMSYINKDDQKSIDRRRYHGTRRIGRTGLEHQYEPLLHGIPGLFQAEVNAHGRVLRIEDRKIPSAGANLILSLDAELQQAASKALEGKIGSIVAIEPDTGDILALANAPTYDPDLLGYSINQKIYQELFAGASKPMLNRAIQGHYAPGSTIKPFMALAGLETGHATMGDKIFAGPHFKLPNYSRPFRDWKAGGHGWVSLTDSITQSCDVYFYSLAHRMGIQPIHDFLIQFGFGQPLQVDLPGERSGLLPSPQWKQQKLGQSWYLGETVNIGIGQGHLLTTPLQLTVATAALATRGVRMRPRLLRGYQYQGATTYPPPEVAARIELSDAYWWQYVTNAMVDVVHAHNGTAKRSGRGARYRIAGKTGTAQVINYGEKYLESSEISEHLRDHSWFIAFAPAEAPQIAMTVLVEHGGHGSAVAAPIARQLLDVYLNRDGHDS